VEEPSFTRLNCKYFERSATRVEKHKQRWLEKRNKRKLNVFVVWPGKLGKLYGHKHKLQLQHLATMPTAITTPSLPCKQAR